jgi:hypothetical protein
MNFDPDAVHLWGWLLKHPAGFWVAMFVVMLMVLGLVAMFWMKGWVGTGERLVPKEQHPHRGRRTKREAAADREADRLASPDIGAGNGRQVGQPAARSDVTLSR